jgi:cation diffusion facilitator family transporter
MHRHDISHYRHAHVFHYSGQQAEKKTMRVVWLTVSMMVVEIAAGWLFNSMALLADGWHMSTHAAALGISWAAFLLARRYAADQRFAFGTWKIEVLGGFVSGILLGIVGIAMAAISTERLFKPASIHFNQAILVASIGLVVNIVSIILLGDRPHDHDHSHQNLNLRAAYLHVLADALTSVLAIVALLGAKYMNWNWLDPMMGLVGAILILRWTRSLLRETGGILLDLETNDELTDEIRKAVESDGDAQISDLHVWKVAQDKYSCILAIVAHHPEAPEHYRARLKEVHELVHVTVEVQPCRDHGCFNMKSCRQKR